MTFSIMNVPRGRAGEYARLSVNLFRGCGHGCTYCYVPGCLRMAKEEWETLQASPKKDALARLRKDLAKIKDSGTLITMSFTTDPFPPSREACMMTMMAVEEIHTSGNRVEIISKGGDRALPVLESLGPGDVCATTITGMSEEHCARYEPNAGRALERVNWLYCAKKFGAFAWISLEPIIHPEETVAVIEATRKFCDLYKVGPLNYAGSDSWKHWPKIKKALSGCRYYMKEDLRKHWPDTGIELCEVWGMADSLTP